MDRLGRKRAAPIAQIASGLAALSLAAAGCGDGDADGTTGSTGPGAPGHATTVPGGGHAGGRATTTGGSGAGEPASPSRQRSPARDVRQAIEDYIAALDATDGERLCSLFVPGALDDLDLPVRRDGCSASVAASLGYRDPRGFPVWTGSAIGGFHTIAIQGDQARATVTILTRYAGNREPSIEDDVIYLRRSGGHWLLVKPSVTLYRAIGVPNAPPQVLAPP
jgi:hypothetical protein